MDAECFNEPEKGGIKKKQKWNKPLDGGITDNGIGRSQLTLTDRFVTSESIHKYEFSEMLIYRDMKF